MVYQKERDTKEEEKEGLILIRVLVVLTSYHHRQSSVPFECFVPGRQF